MQDSVGLNTGVVKEDNKEEDKDEAHDLHINLSEQSVTVFPKFLVKSK